jgi:hypothetical protein
MIESKAGAYPRRALEGVWFKGLLFALLAYILGWQAIQIPKLAYSTAVKSFMPLSLHSLDQKCFSLWVFAKP